MAGNEMCYLGEMLGYSLVFTPNLCTAEQFQYSDILWVLAKSNMLEGEGRQGDRLNRREEEK